MEAASDAGDEQSLCLMTPNYEPWVLTLGGKDSHAYLQNFSQKSPSPYRYEIGKNIPALVGKKIACACYGWLVVTDSKSPDCFILNLITEEVIPLPPVDFNYDVCILSTPPTDPGCRVVFFDEHKDAFFFSRPQDEKFRREKLNLCECLDYAIGDGKIYVWLMNFDQLVCIEFEQSECLLTTVEIDREQFYPADSGGFRSTLLAYSGDIFFICRFNYGVIGQNLAGVQVFKADFSNKKWVAVSNIAPLAIFLNKDGFAHMCCPTTDSKFKPNFIYYFEVFDMNLYGYDLGYRSITMYPTKRGRWRDWKTDYTWMMLPHGTILPRIDEDMVRLQHMSSQGLEWCMVQLQHMSRKGLEGCRLLDSQDKTFQEEANISLEINWAELPLELLGLILSRLFSEDYAVFHGVCKSWQQITPQYLHHSPSGLLEQTATSPLFMFQENSSSDDVPIFRLFDPIHNKHYRMEIPELRGAYIQYSKDGWLLASWREEEETSLIFFNPLTKETVKLPAMPGSQWAWLSFSSTPTSSDCLVSGLMYRDDVHKLLTLKQGDELWLEKNVNNITKDGVKVWTSSECTPVVDKGMHYYLYKGRDMGVFDLNDSETSSDVHSTNSDHINDYRFNLRDEEDYMVDIDGVPALVIVPRHGGVRIYKWDDSKKDWQMMEDPDLGNKNMFLSRRSSFLESVDYGGNKIFLPMLDDAKNVVFYSLKTRKYHTLYSGYSEVFFYNAAKLCGIWLKPLWTRSGG